MSGLKVRLIWVFVFSDKKKKKKNYNQKAVSKTDRGMDYDILNFIFS